MMWRTRLCIWRATLRNSSRASSCRWMADERSDATLVAPTKPRRRLAVESLARSRALYGTDEPIAPSTPLRAGSLTLTLRAGRLWNIALGEIEVWHGVAFLLSGCPLGYPRAHHRPLPFGGVGPRLLDSSHWSLSDPTGNRLQPRSGRDSGRRGADRRGGHTAWRHRDESARSLRDAPDGARGPSRRRRPYRRAHEQVDLSNVDSAVAALHARSRNPPGVRTKLLGVVP